MSTHGVLVVVVCINQVDLLKQCSTYSQLIWTLTRRLYWSLFHFGEPPSVTRINKADNFILDTLRSIQSRFAVFYSIWAHCIWLFFDIYDILLVYIWLLMLWYSPDLDFCLVQRLWQASFREVQVRVIAQPKRHWGPYCIVW